MPIKQQTPNAEVERYLEAKARSLHRALVNNLIYVGEAAVKEARERGRYKDRTGNLRSSIGYCVVDDGKVISGSSFDVVKTGAQGSQEGRKFLTRLVSEHSSGLVLIVVAGMDYAAYVEAKNLNVLDSAEQMSERLIPQLMKQLKI
jgi:hypothetical protein